MRWALAFLLLIGCAVDVVATDGGLVDQAMQGGAGDLAMAAQDLDRISCANGRLDGDESDVDCGGSCPARCAVGATCAGDADCGSGLCIDTTCRAGPTCDDGRQDGNESDVDCGGGCRRCPVGRRCLGRTDCLSGVCSSGTCAACVLDFAARTDLGTGLAPVALALGDLDGDARPEVVVTAVGLDRLGNTIGVLINRGGGAFAPLVSHTVGVRPSAVAVGDVDGDGRRDLVVANAADHTVSVLHNQGGGALGGRKDYVTGPSPYSLALHDLDGDGKLDLVTGDLTGDTVSMFLGGMGGAFPVRASYATGARPRTVALADIDGDGRTDVVTANQGNSLSVLVNRGAVLAAKKDSPARLFSALALGDLDGDNRPDAVVNGNNGAAVGVLLNSGQGAFAAQTDHAMPQGSLAVAIADLDGDGMSDVISSGGDHAVHVLLNRGQAALAAPRSFAVGRGPVALAVGDVDLDGLLDVVTANQTDSTVSLLLNRCR